MRAARLVTAATLAVAAVVGQAHGQDQVPWQPNIETAQQIAAQTHRLVLLHFWGPNCQPCVRVDKEVFSRADVGRALEPNFVMVKLNVEQSPGTARLYGVSSIPTDVIIMPNGRLVSQVQSPPSPQQYVSQMNQFAAGHQELMRRAMTPGAPANTAVAAAAQNPPNNPGPPAQAAGANDRYAEYFAQQPAAGAARPPAGAQANLPPQMAAADAARAQMPAGAPQMAPAQAPPAAAANGDAQATAMRAAYRSGPPAGPKLPPGSPPVGLEGYCPVTLVERQQWSQGAVAFGVVHRGRTYLFLGPNEVKKFLANPDRYSPALSGNDPVLALDNQLAVPGRREFGVFADNKVYLFADEASRHKFEQNPTRYSAESLQAANQAPVVR